MSIAAATDHALVEPAESPLTPESWGKLGMWTFLAADAMTFGALLAGYGALRYGDPTWPRPSTHPRHPADRAHDLPADLQQRDDGGGLAGIRQGNAAKFRKFIALTILGGILFLSLQAYEWTHLIEHGQSIRRNNFGATFFILTGFHGMHVFSGVVYLTIILILGMAGRFTAEHSSRSRSRGCTGTSSI